MLNREVGKMPMRSRRCKDEGASIMPLDMIVREGEANDESKPEELPENSPKTTRKTSGVKSRIALCILPLCVYAQRGFYF